VRIIVVESVHDGGMANVKTKRNQLPINIGHRDFDNKFNWPGKYKAPLPPPVPDPVYPERPKSKPWFQVQLLHATRQWHVIISRMA